MNCDPHTIGYTVNGFPQGVAFCVSKSELNGQPLFPHILTKNQNFTVNFGQLPAPLKPLMPNFVPIGQLDLNDGLVRGPAAPYSRKDCEVLLMIGLPGAGKTFWAEKYSRANPEKRYNILGTNNLINRMKVMGLPRSRNYNGRWEVLIDKCTDCFNTLLKLAAKRKRNYILDQTNVFPTARGRKIKDFQDMTCKAIVVVPNDEEFKRRCTMRTEEFGKEIPESAVIEMKANFVLPEFEEVKSKKFVDILYVELGPQQARELIQKYNAEAIGKGVYMTPAVNQFINRNAKLRADANMFEPIGAMFNESLFSSVGGFKTGKSVSQQNLSSNMRLKYSPLLQENMLISVNNAPNRYLSQGENLSCPHDNKNTFEKQRIDINLGESLPQLSSVKDEFGRDRQLRKSNSQDRKIMNDQQDVARTETINERDRYRHRVEKRESRRSRGRDRNSRSRSRDRNKDGGSFSRRNAHRRNRSRSRERRMHERRPRSRDRSRSRDGGGFGRDRIYRRSTSRTGKYIHITDNHIISQG